MSEELPIIRDMPKSTQVDEVIRCAECGRVLKSQASRDRGVGPKCAAKQEARYQEEFARMVREGQQRLPGTDGVF